ncbi:MAG: SRPBCC domain-containing protein, partial [Phycisphaerales bacterium]|nr:SRPBCC domain-containing protein [Phycisphaerales bacterium]
MRTRTHGSSAFASIIVSVCIAFIFCTPAGRADGTSTGVTSEQSCVVAGSVGDVWKLFATSDGLRSWVAPLAEVDLRIGGSWRTNYNPDGVLGDDSTIESTILCYEPERMLCLQNTKAPKGFAHADA